MCLRRFLSRGGFALPLLLFAPDVQAQEIRLDVPSFAATAREVEIEIDGRLDETDWARAEPAGNFVQGEPIEGAPAEEPTEVRVLYDDGALYIGARLHDSDPESIARQLVRRDDWGQYDAFEVGLDPNGDRRTGYLFRVSAAGVQGDAYLFDDTREDRSWNAIWESAVQIDGEGWSVEMRIPLSQIRYEPADSAQAWGINFSRRRLASNERSYFALISRQRHGVVSVFGRLTGLEIDRGTRRLEVRPYILAGAETAPATPGDPFFDGSRYTSNAGFDLRYGLGTAFTLDLTVNPDFGQVEVDPAVINLSAYETFFPERRPFFVEDARVFDFRLSGGENSLFYSRRVGRSPQGNTPDGAGYTDVPDQSTILGAAKLTGRTSGGLSIGAFAAVTDREEGRAYFDADGTIERFIAEPRTGYGVLRVQQDLRDGGSQVGAIATALRRDLAADGSFDFLPREAFSAGIDFEHSWADRAWALWGFFAGTLVRGPAEAITRIQRSSNHYFQRPDAPDHAVDSAATTMVGAEWRLQFERRSGRHWTGAIWLAERSPGFDSNDLGYFRGSERLDGGARIGYQEITPGSLFRSYRVSASTFHNWRHEALRDAFSADSWGRAHKAGNLSLNGDVTFLNYWSIDLNTRYTPETLSDGATRGGPLMVEPASASVNIRGSTDSRAPISLEPSINVEDQRTGDGGSFRAGLEVNLRPTPRWELELEPRYERSHESRQYVTALDDVAFTPTYGRRYLFADLERRSFSLETRLNYTFTPTLTLQLYAQPLLSAGEYVAYKQLARPESFEFDRLVEGAAIAAGNGFTCQNGRICTAAGQHHIDFDGNGAIDLSIDEQDFNIRSLRGNAVLRWEYRPGSTIFLVWQQNRYLRDTSAAGWSVSRDARELLDGDAENVFLLKVNYWLGL